MSTPAAGGFERNIGRLLPLEGGFTDDPRDSGGATNWGITEAVARAFGYTGRMQDMTKTQASAIYRARFWDPLCLDDVYALAPAVAEELFDTAVNQGTQAAGKYLQRCLNVLNSGGRLYADIQADGRVGKITVAALREYLGRRGAEGAFVLKKGLNALQGAFYVELAERREKDEAFVYGWLKNRT